MKKFLPYFSNAGGAPKRYHNFLDCPIGARIDRAHREPGVGPDGVLYRQCQTCKAWDEQIERERVEREARVTAAYLRLPSRGSG